MAVEPEDRELSNEEFFAKHGGLLYKAARIVTKHRDRYTSADALGTMWLHCRKCLSSPTFDFDKGTFVTYMFRGVFRAFIEFWRKDAEFQYALGLTAADYKQIDSEKAYHESEFFMYRIPERDGTWTDAIIGMFDGTDRLWASLTEYCTTKQKQTVEDYYRKGLTLREIAEAAGTSKQAVEQNLKGAMRHIKTKVEKLSMAADMLGVGIPAAGTDRISQ